VELFALEDVQLLVIQVAKLLVLLLVHFNVIHGVQAAADSFVSLCVYQFVTERVFLIADFILVRESVILIVQ
jgi:hypothetical protein